MLATLKTSQLLFHPANQQASLVPASRMTKIDPATCSTYECLVRIALKRVWTVLHPEPAFMQSDSKFLLNMALPFAAHLVSRQRDKEQGHAALSDGMSFVLSASRPLQQVDVILENGSLHQSGATGSPFLSRLICGRYVNMR